MKTTNDKIAVFVSFASTWLDQNKEDTQFRQYVKKALKQVTKPYQEYNESQEDLNIEYCAVEPDKIDGKDNPRAGVIIRNPDGTYAFTKAQLADRNKKLRDLFRNKEVEVDVVFAPNFPMTLTDSELQAFEGFVIPEVKDE